MPRYKSQYAREWDEASRAAAGMLAPNVDLPEGIEVRSGNRARLTVTERGPYGPDSQHSFFRDLANSAGKLPDPAAQERIQRSRVAAEQRAVTSSTLGGIVPGEADCRPGPRR